MALLSRYLLRQLAAPFAFALLAATGMLLLNQVALRFGDLVGKGLPAGVIAEVFALSLPFIVAMTLPMACLLAVLYAFSHLAADNEITAMRAAGLSVPQLLVPVLGWGLVMAVVAFGFIDQVLPRTNARLRTLWLDILRKKPTFELREQAINPIPNSPYALRASRIDPETGFLQSVTIFDLASQNSRRVIHADSGRMGFGPNGRDLTLHLWSGTVLQLKNAEPDRFDLDGFRETDFRIPDVLDSLQRSQEGLARSDREMGTCEMQAVVDSARHDLAAATHDRALHAERDLHLLLGLASVPARRLPRTAPPRSVYCTLVHPPDTAAGLPPLPLAPILSTPVDLDGFTAREGEARRRIARFQVEIHKKWALAMACVVFVFVGLPVAVRFPRGGIGLVVGLGMLAYALYNLGLTAGEALADRALVVPWAAMWLPNAVFLAAGVLALWSVSREFGSTRGGDVDEILAGLRRLNPFAARA